MQKKSTAFFYNSLPPFLSFSPSLSLFLTPLSFFFCLILSLFLPLSPSSTQKETLLFSALSCNTFDRFTIEHKMLLTLLYVVVVVNAENG